MATRDLPHSFSDFAFGWSKHLPQEITVTKAYKQRQAERRERDAQILAARRLSDSSSGQEVDGAGKVVKPTLDVDPNLPVYEEVDKVKMKNLWPAFAAGAGLFSDGYINNGMSAVNACLTRIYGKKYTNSNAMSNVSSIAFVGIVVGQLGFGYISDRVARKGGMLAATFMLIFFSLMCAVGTWGAHGSAEGLFASLTAFRFFLGIAIGAEYPTSSVIASEFANQLPAGRRNRYFCWFTNAMIDFGYVVSAFVPLVLLWIFSTRHLTAVWRLTLGLGCIPPLSLLFFRLKLKDGEAFQKTNMKRVKKYPYWLIIKFYWFRLTIVSLIWFIYDFSVYAFGTYSTNILATLVPPGDMYKSFGWNVVLNLFYMPGAFLGALSADYIGPRLTIAIGVGLQGVIGFCMAGKYESLAHPVGGFVVVFGIFYSLGEFGPGDNLGLLASKTSATPVRGQYYGIAAAVGKIGAFVGTWVFPVIQRRLGEIKGPVYISSGLCFFSAFLAIFFCPSVSQDCIEEEDQAFLAYLESNGYDITQLGDRGVVEDVESSASNISSPNKESDIQVHATKKGSA